MGRPSSWRAAAIAVGLGMGGGACIDLDTLTSMKRGPGGDGGGLDASSSGGDAGANCGGDLTGNAFRLAPCATPLPASATGGPLSGLEFSGMTYVDGHVYFGSYRDDGSVPGRIVRLDTAKSPADPSAWEETKLAVPTSFSGMSPALTSTGSTSPKLVYAPSAGGSAAAFPYFTSFVQANVQATALSGSFSGVVHVGKLLVFVPAALASSGELLVADADTLVAASVKLSTSQAYTFEGGVFGGGNVYFVETTGRMLRVAYSNLIPPYPRTVIPEECHLVPPVVAEIAEGFGGAATDGVYAYFFPNASGKFVARVDTRNANFCDPASWMIIHLPTIAQYYKVPFAGIGGAAMDSTRSLYLAKRGGGLAFRLDTQAADPRDPSAWSVRQGGGAGGDPTAPYTGMAFDGRYMYAAWKGNVERFDIGKLIGAPPPGESFF